MEILEEIFEKIKLILEKNSEGLFTTAQYIGSQAKQKPGFHLYGNKEVSLLGKKPQQTYIAGVIQQKNYVSFYFSPIYSHPEEFVEINPNLRKTLKGKSCFNINKITPQFQEDLEDILRKGIEMYKKIKWI